MKTVQGCFLNGDVVVLNNISSCPDHLLLFSADVDGDKLLQAVISRRVWGDAYLIYAFNPVCESDDWSWEGSQARDLSETEKAQAQALLDKLCAHPPQVIV